MVDGSMANVGLFSPYCGMVLDGSVQYQLVDCHYGHCIGADFSDPSGVDHVTNVTHIFCDPASFAEPRVNDKAK